MSSERVKATFKELANLCSDPEKPALLEPLRREICAEYVKRSLEKAILFMQTSETTEAAGPVREAAKAKIEKFLSSISNPFLVVGGPGDRHFLTCVVLKGLILDDKLVFPPSILTAPLDKVVHYVFAEWLDCSAVIH